MVINIVVPQSKEKTLKPFEVKDKYSALSHFIGFVLSIVLAPILLIKGALDNKSLVELISYAIFTLSMILLYGSSTAYHSFNLPSEEKNKRLKKLDHMMISVLIAGTYTPLCVSLIKGREGIILLSVVWSLALISIIFKAFWVTCPRFVSSIIYLAIGWACAPVLGKLYTLLTPKGFRLLLSGGILYTIGGVIYATKLPLLEKNKEFKSHELFHLFILGGTIFHFLMVYFYVA